MSQYAWICLNNADYDWIYWYINEKTECWICLNSECVWYSTYYKVTVQITEHLLKQTHIQNTVKHLRKKEQCLKAGQVCNQKFLRAGQGGGGDRGMRLGHFNNHSVKNTKRRGCAGKHFWIFLLDTIKTTIWIENLNS